MCDFEWNTIWTAVGAIATVVGAIAVIFARTELRFNGWLKAQEVFTDEEFTEARARLFARLETNPAQWTEEEEKNGLRVCRKMEELAALATYFPKKTILREWGNSIAKAWLLLEPLVIQERKKTSWNGKWRAFEKLGKEALLENPHLLRQSKTQSGK